MRETTGAASLLLAIALVLSGCDLEGDRDRVPAAGHVEGPVTDGGQTPHVADQGVPQLPGPSEPDPGEPDPDTIQIPGDPP